MSISRPHASGTSGPRVCFQVLLSFIRSPGAHTMPTNPSAGCLLYKTPSQGQPLSGTACPRLPGASGDALAAQLLDQGRAVQPQQLGGPVLVAAGPLQSL